MDLWDTSNSTVNLVATRETLFSKQWIYGLKQQNTSVSEFYTNMKCVWEEIDSMEDLPKVNSVTAEMSEFFKALSKHKDDQKLFQFLNRLNGDYNTHRRQILFMIPSLV